MNLVKYACHNKGDIMKKIFTLMLIILFAVSIFPLSAHASTNDVRIENLNLNVSIPHSFSIINDNIPANDSVFEKLGISKSELLSQLKEKNIYLNCISKNNNEEIVVTMIPNSISDFNLLSDTSLEALGSALVDQYKSYNISVSKYEVYQQEQAKFIKVYFQDSSQSAYGVQYYTIYDKKAMNFTLRSYEGKISSSQENTIKSIVDSIKFDAEAQKYNEGADTSSFAYQDNTAGINFTVPNNWGKTPLSKERQFIDVKFSSTKEDGLSIMFGATDLWSRLSSSEKAGMTRADFNDTQLTASNIADMLALDSSKVFEKTYNNIHFYLTEVTSSSEIYGMNLTVTITHAIHIQNGWIYWFQFAATKDSPYYKDFENMLSSVYIKGEIINNNISAGLLKNNENTNPQNNPESNIWIVLLMPIIIVILIVLNQIKKKKTKRATIQKTTIIKADENNDTELGISNNIEYRFCHRCGEKIALSSKFCHKCGTEIVGTEE